MTRQAFAPGARVVNPQQPPNVQEGCERPRRVRACWSVGGLSAAVVFVRCCGQDCPRAELGRNDGARVVNPQQPPNVQEGCERPRRVRRAGGWAVGGLVVFVRCCGQDCPRAELGRNDGARVVNPQQPPNVQEGCERPGVARVLVGRLGCRRPGLPRPARTRLSARRVRPK